MANMIGGCRNRKRTSRGETEAEKLFSVTQSFLISSVVVAAAIALAYTLNTIMSYMCMSVYYCTEGEVCSNVVFTQKSHKSANMMEQVPSGMLMMINQG